MDGRRNVCADVCMSFLACMYSSNMYSCIHVSDRDRSNSISRSHTFDSHIVLILTGIQIEPVCMVPIVPLILINGAEGIATGWATSITLHHPLQVIDAVESLLRAPAGTGWEELPRLDPWFLGFKGRIEPLASGDGFETHGVITRVRRPGAGPCRRAAYPALPALRGEIPRHVRFLRETEFSPFD